MTMASQLLNKGFLNVGLLSKTQAKFNNLNLPKKEKNGDMFKMDLISEVDVQILIVMLTKTTYMFH